ncbi:MAG: RDD family protein [Acidobacteria bacterium]|nr:RDD family protein [Acidobacteriota bacterium]
MICPFCLKAVPTGSAYCPGCNAAANPDMVPQYAGIFRRFMAVFLDVLIMNLVYAVLFVPLWFIAQDQGEEFLMIAMAVPSLVLLGLVLLQLILLLTSGQTIGKKMLKIKIVKEDYQKATFGTIFGREIVGRFLCGLTAGIGYLIALFNDRKQGLHDKVARTIVVQKTKPGQAAYAAPAWQPPQPDFVPPPYPADAQSDPIAPPPLLEETAPPPPLEPEPDVWPAPPPAFEPEIGGSMEETVPPLFEEPIRVEEAPAPPQPPAPPIPPAPPVAPEVPAAPPVAPLAAAAVDAPLVCPACKSPLESHSPDRCGVCGFSLKEHEALPVGEAEVGEATVVVTAPQLITYSPEGQQETYTLQLPITKIGRLKDNHLSFPREKAISGHHCVIYLEKNQFFIRDINSTNGVFVNSKKVEESPLADGDKIKLGFKVFQFKTR